MFDISQHKTGKFAKITIVALGRVRVNGGCPRFNTHWRNILLLDIFCFYVVEHLMPILLFLPVLCVCIKLD